MKPEETILHLGEEVYVRYDPADLKNRPAVQHERPVFVYLGTGRRTDAGLSDL